MTRIRVFRSWSNPDAFFSLDFEAVVVPLWILMRDFFTTYREIKEAIERGEVVKILRSGELTAESWLILPAEKAPNRLPAKAGRMEHIGHGREMIWGPTTAEPVYEGSLFKFLIQLRRKYQA